MKTKFFLCIFIISISILSNDNDKNRKFLQAAQQNNLDEVRKLIEDKAKINMQNKEGQTALHLTQDSAIIHELIISGASLNKTDKEGKTPLFQALLDNNMHKAMTLLYAGAKTNTMVQGFTPLHWAIEKKDYQLVFELVKGGAKVKPKVISYAKKLDDNDIASLLEHYCKFKGKKSSIQIFDANGQTKMHDAVAQNNPILVDSLSLAGASINSKNHQGQTPMHIAVDHDLPEMTKKLLDLNAQINIADNTGETPFHYATRKGSFKISSILQQHGAAYYLTDNNEITPLNYIQQHKNLVSLMPVHFQKNNMLVVKMEN